MTTANYSSFCKFAFNLLNLSVDAHVDFNDVCDDEGDDEGDDGDDGDDQYEVLPEALLAELPIQTSPKPASQT